MCSMASFHPLSIKSFDSPLWRETILRLIELLTISFNKKAPPNVKKNINMDQKLACANFTLILDWISS